MVLLGSNVSVFLCICLAIGLLLRVYTQHYLAYIILGAGDWRLM